MKPGPAPKPTALKRLAGNPGKRRLSDREPQPERTLPAMPRGLRRRAKKFWQEHSEKLDRLGVLTEVDGPAFTMMAIHYETAWDAYQQIKQDGLLLEDKNDVARKHPLLQVMRENSAAFLRYAAHFGLTPSARSRLEIGEPPDQDDYEAFLNG